ncbi:glycosyltransferase family 2 protein [Chloroflexota bacterium]
MLDVSVIVCARNAEFNIEACLESIRENNPREIILVDGHSSDRTVEIAEKYTTSILYDPGRGLAVARNIGIDHANAKYQCFVGPDNIMPPDSISKCISYLEENDYAGVSVVTFIKNPRQGYFAQALNFYKKARFYPGERDIIGTPYVFKAEILKKFRFDPMFTNSDDTDLCMRLSDNGFKVGISDVIVYEAGFENLSSINERWSRYGKGDFLFYSKYSPNWGIKRKIYSFSHPLRDELVFPFIKALPRQKFLLLPFLILITSIRYISWFRHWVSQWFQTQSPMKQS